VPAAAAAGHAAPASSPGWGSAALRIIMPGVFGGTHTYCRRLRQMSNAKLTDRGKKSTREFSIQFYLFLGFLIFPKRAREKKKYFPRWSI
jgi:hypothetical protein